MNTLYLEDVAIQADQVCNTEAVSCLSHDIVSGIESTHTHKSIHAHTHTYCHTRTCTDTQTHLCTHIYTHTHAHTHTHTNTHIHTHTRMHIHTHIQTHREQDTSRKDRLDVDKGVGKRRTSKHTAGLHADVAKLVLCLSVNII